MRKFFLVCATAQRIFCPCGRFSTFEQMQHVFSGSSPIFLRLRICSCCFLRLRISFSVCTPVPRIFCACAPAPRIIIVRIRRFFSVCATAPVNFFPCALFSSFANVIHVLSSHTQGFQLSRTTSTYFLRMSTIFYFCATFFTCAGFSAFWHLLHVLSAHAQVFCVCKIVHVCAFVYFFSLLLVFVPTFKLLLVFSVLFDSIRMDFFHFHALLYRCFTSFARLWNVYLCMG